MVDIAERGTLPPARRRADAVPAVPGDDWPTQATDAIVRVVGTVRDRSAEPALTVARAVVYGLLAAIVGTAAVVLVTAGVVRFLDAYLPEAWFGESHVWAVYLILGVLCTAGGLFALGRGRRIRPE